jgi:hypothetical protein
MLQEEHMRTEWDTSPSLGKNERSSVMIAAAIAEPVHFAWSTMSGMNKVGTYTKE